MLFSIDFVIYDPKMYISDEKHELSLVTNLLLFIRYIQHKKKTLNANCCSTN